ncbi:MAG: hypothetical protein J7500_15060 [Sphingomonas sp.]|uniref:hypothetical protein n=1 Tax=Sphingomonas sp. TaxID=28214 RepID=UPI001B0D89AC|nr:hypothetical protein [Sphingomonas sp.]MBO9624026.1 hypothetical protein [Sphingomonas sp.]
MDEILYLGDRGDVADATALIREFGEDACWEAAARAEHSRALGNHIHFCRWRQIERLVTLLAGEEVMGTVH